MKHQSWHRPNQKDLTNMNSRAARRRLHQQLKGYVNMKRALAMGAAAVAFGVAGIGYVMAEDTEYTPGCWYDAGGAYACDGSPVASPVPVVTPEPTATATETPLTGIESITTLPSTGVGPGR